MKSTSRSGSRTSRWTRAGLCAASAIIAAACGGSERPASPAPTPAAHPVDLILVDGDVRTMDPERPRASAVAIRGGRIAAVGDDREIRALASAGTRMIELGGRSVSPGLVDSHCHLYGLGKALVSLDVRGVESPEGVARRAAAAASERGAGEWITGRGWDQNLWPGQEFSTAAVLDAAVASHPVALRRVDGHALWANSAAMTAAGVTAETADPPGGKILRDEDGAPTGVFIDNAMELVEAAIPAADAAEIERRILAAAEVAVSVGLTGVHEMGISTETEAVYRKLAAEGQLPLRVYAFLSGSAELAQTLADRPPDVDGDGTAMFTVRAIKLFADGALGSRGAALLAPYADEPESRGLWITEAGELAEAATAVADAGWQLGVHAIGDAGNRAVLDAYEGALAGLEPGALRFRVEHAQVLAPADLGRFAELGVIASMQPTHATSDMPWAEARLGSERIRGAYAWRSLADSGARLALGSDFPVERVEPLRGVYAAITRQNERGMPEGGWYPEERMTLAEALRGFTAAGAYASFSEDRRGMLRPGYIADLTVYDRRLEANSSLLETHIDFTVVGGEVVFERQ